ARRVRRLRPARIPGSCGVYFLPAAMVPSRGTVARLVPRLHARGSGVRGTADSSNPSRAFVGLVYSARDEVAGDPVDVLPGGVGRLPRVLLSHGRWGSPGNAERALGAVCERG